MKIIFIDIDGVLVPDKCQVLQHKWCGTDVDHWCHFDSFTVEFLNEVFKCETNLFGVVHSTWKKYYNEDELKYFFTENGCEFRWHDDMIADNKIKQDDRWDDISNWLKLHPEISKSDYVIIDDMKPTPEHKTRTVRTNEQNGFTHSNCNRLLTLLQISFKGK